MSFGIARRLALEVLPFHVRAGFTATRTLKHLQELGIGYRSQQFFRDFKEIKTFNARESASRKLSIFRRPPESLFTTKRSPIGKKYVYRFEVTEYNSLTGLEEKVVKSVASSKRISLKKAMNEIYVTYETEYGIDNREFVKADYIGGLKRGN